ncbi:unnamed protein product [Callosobruchus maculatus]|uniref:Uncharacterized protein n=1 Tax=Callosobruchus maculatus TaxID=64391 RepID=A0A653CRS5_CALMS|nr:unnamed protein product [Callosobruchus maculatus]
MWLSTLVFSYLFVSECRGSEDIQNSTEFFSKYAKVAKWGSDLAQKQKNSMGHAGQSLWSQRMDVNIAENSSFSNRERVFRQYPVYRKTSDGNEESEKAPRVGEVIQDRFNVRPYMGYGQSHSKPSGVVSPPVYNNPPQNLPAFDSYSVASTQNPPGNLYTSAYSSYNPPSNAKPNESLEKYPPLLQDSYAAPPVQDNGGKYEPPKQETLGPPLYPEKDFDPTSSDQEYDGHEGLSEDEVHSPKVTSNSYYPPDFSGDAGSPDESGANIRDTDDTKPQPFKGRGTSGNDAPPKHPPKSIDDVYYPDYNAGDTPVGSKPPMDDAMDLAPPDSHNEHFEPHFYEDHHIYEEVPHTTTEATKKRVSNTHYSYYYLGRKLWYIPLYFSIYFVIYVMILIVKAIARHKVQYKHDWLTTHSRSSRKLDSYSLDGMRTVDEVHRNVTEALDHLNKKYLNFAM